MLFVYFCKRYQSKMNLLHKYILITLLAVLSVSCNRFIAIERNDYLSSDTAFVKYVAEEQMPYSTNNSVTMLDGAQEKFDSLFNDIRNAKHHIHLEYFNFRHDSINNVLLTLLAQKAKEGVEVRAMFDAFGNLSNNQPLKRKDLEKIRATGIEIIKFFPASCYGGIKTLKALGGPFKNVKFLPTGGVDESNILEYLALDSVVAIGGSFMMKGDIKENTKRVLELIGKGE